MIADFFSLRRQRSFSEALVFYVVNLVFVTAVVMLISKLMATGAISGVSAELFARFSFGLVFSLVFCTVMYYAIYWRKKLRSVLFLSLGIVNIVATILGGALVGLVLVALLTTQQES